MLRLLTLLAAAGCATTCVAAEQQARYVALLANGKRIEGDRLSNWYDGGGVPHLGNQSLLPPTNSFRWLRDRTRRLAHIPEAYVEFTNGDRLPGTVIDYRSGQEDSYQPLPPHLIVRVSLQFEPPENKPVPEVRVLAQFVRRIVWHDHGSAAPQPGTAVYMDGRALAFRALRFRAGEINVLTAEGGRRIEWSELAELNLPAVDAWTAWFDQVVAVCPSADSRLLELETSTGLIATASPARLAARFEGNSADSDRWVHGLQPAWSLDILWAPIRDMACYRSYAANEAPLSRIAPQRVLHREGLSGPRPVQVNRNVHGEALASKTQEFGYGLGVGGGAQVTFEVPAGAQSLSAAVCLDRSAGEGGCVRPRIFANSTASKPLWEGPILVGSQQVADTGLILLSGRVPGAKSIILEADPVLAGRPAGADPLDIRDHVNWCDPLLVFAPEMIQAEFDKRLSDRFFAWNGWEAAVEGDKAAAAGLHTTFHRTDSIPGEFVPAVNVLQRPLVLRRQWTPRAEENWLVISASRVKPGLPDPRIEVRIGGQSAGEATIPDLRRGEDARLIVVQFKVPANAVGRSVPIEIRQQANEKSSGVVYRSITIADHPPTLFRLFEDEAEPLPLAAGEMGEAQLVSDEKFTGAKALQFTPSGQFRVDLPLAVRIREQPKLGEARFIRFAALKRGGGRVAVELADSQPREKPARYDLGSGEPAYGSAERVHDGAPAEWTVITRDLFADFGNLDAQALIVGCIDGEAAYIDHVYLARSRSDFPPLPGEAKPPQP